MSKPGADPSSGISLGDALRLPGRHPACRRREAQSGSRKKRTCSGHATNSRRYRDLGSTCLCRGREWLDLNGVATSVPTARRKPNIVSFAAGRQCRWSTCTERENLAGDAKGKGTSGSNREAESTDAPGLPCSSSHRLCRPTANETLLSHCRVVGIELRRRVCFFVVLKRGNARGAKGVGHRL